MRKGFLVSLTLFLFFPVFSQDFPQLLSGIWEGKDRFVLFNQNQTDENPIFSLYLKEYYGWYIDRTVEPENFSKDFQRNRNAGTTKDIFNVDFSYINSKITEDSWAGYINLKYSKSQKNCIPVCIFDNKMYTDFYLQDENNNQFYKGCAVSKGLTINEQIIPENINCYLIDDEKIFSIRYWKSGMEYSDENAFFQYEDIEFVVPKHVRCGEIVYSCVSGRSKKIRNMKNPEVFNKEDFLFNNDSSLMIKKQDFYLYKLQEHKSVEDLMEIVKVQNSKRKPDPPPLFPPDGLGIIE